MKPFVLVILGPTATGKSDLAVQLAKKFSGEIISADSRQVYKDLNIGTGKVTKKEMRGIPHHLIDVISPKKIFTVAQWKKQAEIKISEIISRGKLPIICGGTGFYIESVVYNITSPEVPPNKKLRTKLQKEPPSKLFEILQKLDPERAQNIDSKNSVRLIRAIEIAQALGKVPKINKEKSKYNFIQIGLTLPQEELRKKIYTRLISRIKKGMIKEVQELQKNNLSWKRMKELGLEYRYISKYLQKKLSKEDMIQKLEKEISHYSKRQMTWFKKDKNIAWFHPNQTKEIVERIKNSLH